METLGCETLQHSTLRGLIISPFRLNGKARNMLGSRCCFGAATEFRSPTGAWTPSAFGFLKAASPCPPTHTCSLTARGQGHVTLIAFLWLEQSGHTWPSGVCSHLPGAASAGRNCVSACLHCLLALSPPRKVTSAAALLERLFWMTLQEQQLLTHLLFQ